MSEQIKIGLAKVVMVTVAKMKTIKEITKSTVVVTVGTAVTAALILPDLLNSAIQNWRRATKISETLWSDALAIPKLVVVAILLVMDGNNLTNIVQTRVCEAKAKNSDVVGAGNKTSVSQIKAVGWWSMVSIAWVVLVLLIVTAFVRLGGLITLPGCPASGYGTCGF